MKEKKPEFTFCEFIGGNNKISGGYPGESYVNAVASGITSAISAVTNVISGTPVVDENTKERPLRSALPTTDPIKDENVANAMKDLKAAQPLIYEDDVNEDDDGIVQKFRNWWYGKKLKKTINQSIAKKLMENNRNDRNVINEDAIIIANDEDEDTVAMNYLQGMIINKPSSKTQSKTQSKPSDNSKEFDYFKRGIINRPVNPN
jgi:hypothetical protein